MGCNGNGNGNGRILQPGSKNYQVQTVAHESAFPSSFTITDTHGGTHAIVGGMTALEYGALQVVSGMLGRVKEIPKDVGEIAAVAVTIADAVIQECRHRESQFRQENPES